MRPAWIGRAAQRDGVQLPRAQAQTFLKSTELVREAVNCNAGLGEHDWLPTTVYLPQSYHVSSATVLELWLRNEAGATQASARSGVCARFGAPSISHGRSFASQEERSTWRVAQSFLDAHMRVSRRVVRDGHRLAAAFAFARRACRGSGVHI